MRLSDLKSVRLEIPTIIKPFDCDDTDLNDFLKNDAKKFTRLLLTVTNLFEYGDTTVAFYSVLNDRIIEEDSITKSAFKKVVKELPFEKRHFELPAVKIGRLGVDKQYQGGGIGTQILDNIKMSFTTKNKTGCRYITVDAYNNDKTINFYKKNGFDFFPVKEEKEKTTLMYFDLMTFVHAREKLLQTAE